MTSEECCVYVFLPQNTQPVTAGKFILKKNKVEISVGRFIYGKSYLVRSDAVEIYPIELRLDNKVFETAIMEVVFGAIRDASPYF